MVPNEYVAQHCEVWAHYLTSMDPSTSTALAIGLELTKLKFE